MNDDNRLNILREAFDSLSSDYQRLESDVFDANDRIEKLSSTMQTFIGWSVIIGLLALISLVVLFAQCRSW
jgi:hypothetical protein